MRGLLRVILGSKKTVILGLVCGAFLGATSVALAAVSAKSGVAQTPTIYGHVYDSYSTVYTNEAGSPSDWASTTDYTQQGSNAAPGYIGVDARKFKNGALCEQTGYVYNQFAENSFTIYANAVACGSGTYYSYGLFQAYNGSGYNTYYSGQSPNLNG